MMRWFKQSDSSQSHSADEQASLLKSVFANDAIYSGNFAKAIELADKHTTAGSLTRKWAWEDYCEDLGESCGCEKRLLPEQVRFWKGVFSFLPSKRKPSLISGEYVMTPFTDWLLDPDNTALRDNYPEKASTYNPVIYASFYYPKGLGYDDYVSLKPELSAAMEGYKVAIQPVGDINGHHEEQRGSVSGMGFRVLVLQTGDIDRFSHEKHLNTFSAWELFDHDFWKINRSVVFSSQMLTHPSSSSNVGEIKFAADDTMTSGDLLMIAEMIKGRTGVLKVSVKEETGHEFFEVPSMSSRKIYVAHFGDN